MRISKSFIFGLVPISGKVRIASNVKFLLLAVSIGLCISAAKAGWYEAIAAYKRGDHAAAQKHWHVLAVNGDASAQFNLGLMRRGGIGVSKDFNKALVWFKKAASKGKIEALVHIGDMHANGEGIPQNYQEAIKYYRLAAEHSLAGAHHRLGHLYLAGKGVPQNMSRAVELFTRAAENNYPHAQYQLAVMNEKAQGVPEDKVSAYLWYSAAASNLKGEAQQRVRFALESLLNRMTVKEITQAAIKAAKELPTVNKPNSAAK